MRVVIDENVAIEYSQRHIDIIVLDKTILYVDLKSGTSNLHVLSKAKSRNELIDNAFYAFINDHGLMMEAKGVSVPIDTLAIQEQLATVAKELKTIQQRVIIPVGGSGERWGNYLGIKKQDINIGGETILNRTIRQVKASGFDDIYLSKEREHGDASKYMGSVDHWNKEGRTVFLLGDVYYTDKAIHTILFDDSPDWRMFGRAMPNARKDHPEPFGLSFYPEHHDRIKQGAKRVIDLFESNKTDGAGFLFLYRALVGLPDKLMLAHLYGENWIDINDITDDFDNPDDYHSFMEHHDV